VQDQGPEQTPLSMLTQFVANETFKLGVGIRTASIAIKPVTTVNMTSHRKFPPLSEETGGGNGSVFVTTFGLVLGFGVTLCSLPESVTGVEIRLYLDLLFPLGTLGVELIVVKSNARVRRVERAGAKFGDG